MALIALLSNPSSTGNRAFLPKLRSFCAGRSDVFHYEVENASQIGDGLKSIARVKPRVLVINGGDGTVQATLTELYHGGQFGREPPPVAVLPNGKTNLIALDLGSQGDPLKALERILELAQGDLAPHVVQRELIALTEGDHGKRPVLGMFLGGAGLADTILYCRHQIYPLGLPNGLSHVIAGIAVIFSMLFGIRGRYLPPAPNPVRVSLIRDGQGTQRFAFLIVTTLEKLLLSSRTERGGTQHGLKLMAIDQSLPALLRGLWASMLGKLGRDPVSGVHVEHGDVIRIESDGTSVILDGETFSAIAGRPIVLRSTSPVPFLRIAV
jgi:Diacylglycerol kinase catalytic domain